MPCYSVCHVYGKCCWQGAGVGAVLGAVYVLFRVVFGCFQAVCCGTKLVVWGVCQYNCFFGNFFLLRCVHIWLTWNPVRPFQGIPGVDPPRCVERQPRPCRIWRHGPCCGLPGLESGRGRPLAVCDKSRWNFLRLSERMERGFSKQCWPPHSRRWKASCHFLWFAARSGGEEWGHRWRHLVVHVLCSFAGFLRNSACDRADCDCIA